LLAICLLGHFVLVVTLYSDSQLRRKSSQEAHRGFGYVEFTLAEDAHEAIDNMDQAELYGRVIKVNQAKPQKQAGEKLGSKTAVWEQVSFCFSNSTWSSRVCVLSTRHWPSIFPRVTSGSCSRCDFTDCLKNRRITLPNTTSVKRTGWPWRTVPTSLWILCKDSKVWIKLDRSSIEWLSLSFIPRLSQGRRGITLFQRGVWVWEVWCL
jgi:hypothetical protein